MLDLRRARSTSLRMEPADGRRSSFWIPAFMAAAAASECGAVCETGGDCARVGEVAVGVVAVDGLEGGRLLRSGGMLMAMVHGHRCGDDDVLGIVPMLSLVGRCSGGARDVCAHKPAPAARKPFILARHTQPPLATSSCALR
jgi:hypothetical protein